MSELQKQRKKRLRELNQSKKRKEAGIENELLNLQNKVAQLEKKKTERVEDNDCNADTMDTDSVDICRKSDSGGSKGKANSNSNTDSATYVIDTSITKNTKSKCLDTITESIICNQ